MLNSKQYYLEFGTSMILYAAAVVLSISILTSNPETPWAILISLLPMLPAIFATAAVIRALKKLDELQQRIQLTSFAVSFAVVGLTTFSYGFLENVGFPHIPYLWVFPFMVCTWGIATPIVARTYK